MLLRTFVRTASILGTPRLNFNFSRFSFPFSISLPAREMGPFLSTPACYFSLGADTSFSRMEAIFSKKSPSIPKRQQHAPKISLFPARIVPPRLIYLCRSSDSALVPAASADAERQQGDRSYSGHVRRSGIGHKFAVHFVLRKWKRKRTTEQGTGQDYVCSTQTIKGWAGCCSSQVPKYEPEKFNWKWQISQYNSILLVL